MRSLRRCFTGLSARHLFLRAKLPAACRAYHLPSTAPAAQTDSKGRVVLYNPPAAYRGTDGGVTFAQLGISHHVLKALPQAFPAVKYPTETQQQLIGAVLKGKDVLLKDHTGTGKSFGLLLALLSVDRHLGLAHKRQLSDARSSAVTALFIVPHRDLAYQLMRWVERIHAHSSSGKDLDSVAQALVRNAATPIPDQIARLRASPPQILIGTPQAVFDVLQEDESVLQLETLSAVVVDEVDYLLECMPRHADEYTKKKALRQMRAHPSVTRQILDRIYGGTAQPSKEKHDAARRPASNPTRPQLIMSSATFRVSYRLTFLRDQWFKRDPGALVRITGQTKADDAIQPSEEDAAGNSLGGTAIQHHAIVVSASGAITNIQGATDPSGDGPIIPESEITAAHQTDTSSAADGGAGLDDSRSLPFNPHLLEAVAETFALDVPGLALLVLPASAPVRQIISELRVLGVNALSLDVYQEGKGDDYLTQGLTSGATDDPTLLVSTLASTRGMDLPDLTHVFILGIPEDRPADTYLHAAGRVGRFGRSGKVVSVLAARHAVATKKGKEGWRDEAQKMQNVFKSLRITPRKVAYFP